MAGVCLGQTTTSRSDSSRDRATSASTETTGPDARDLYRQSRGSLFRAGMASTPPQLRGSFESASLLYTPPPEPKVVKKHDLVTIIIREESTTKADAKADMKRESELDARIEEFIKVALGNFELQGGGIDGPVPSIKASASRDFKGDGKVNRTDSFVARIQAEVVDVKPNGTLVLQARKKINNDDETQTFILSGICRAEDVTADNSVLSTQLFDLELSKSTNGPVRDATKRGAVHKFFDWLNPF